MKKRHRRRGSVLCSAYFSSFFVTVWFLRLVNHESLVTGKIDGRRATAHRPLSCRRSTSTGPELVLLHLLSPKFATFAVRCFNRVSSTESRIQRGASGLRP